MSDYIFYWDDEEVSTNESEPNQGDSQDHNR